MKKILILALLFTSCGYAPMDRTKGIIITEIKTADINTCYYYGYGNMGIVFSPCDVRFVFRDTCGKFQIGDTLKIVK